MAKKLKKPPLGVERKVTQEYWDMLGSRRIRTFRDIDFVTEILDEPLITDDKLMNYGMAEYEAETIAAVTLMGRSKFNKLLTYTPRPEMLMSYLYMLLDLFYIVMDSDYDRSSEVFSRVCDMADYVLETPGSLITTHYYDHVNALAYMYTTWYDKTDECVSYRERLLKLVSCPALGSNRRGNILSFLYLRDCINTLEYIELLGNSEVYYSIKFNRDNVDIQDGKAVALALRKLADKVDEDGMVDTVIGDPPILEASVISYSGDYTDKGEVV